MLQAFDYLVERKYQYITHLRVFLSNSLKPTRFQKPYLSYITMILTRGPRCLQIILLSPACLLCARAALHCIFWNFCRNFENPCDICVEIVNEIDFVFDEPLNDVCLDSIDIRDGTEIKKELLTKPETFQTSAVPWSVVSANQDCSPVQI